VLLRAWFAQSLGAAFSAVKGVSSLRASDVLVYVFLLPYPCPVALGQGPNFLAHWRFLNLRPAFSLRLQQLAALLGDEPRELFRSLVAELLYLFYVSFIG
jgi:hypothetical protein